MLVLNSSSANTFGWLFQLGLGGALILFCTDSSFHRVRRDKAASSLLYHSHSKPFNCERSFNAVPLRGEKNNLKMVHFLANSHKITSQFKCGQPLKVQCFYLNKASLGFFSFFNWCLQNNHLKIWKLLQKVIPGRLDHLAPTTDKYSTVEKSRATSRWFVLNAAMETGNKSSDLQKNMQAFREIQYVRQKQRLYRSNEFESLYLVWPPSFFKKAWTGLYKLSVIYFRNSSPGFLKDISKLFFRCLLPFVLFSVKMIPPCFSNVQAWEGSIPP